MISWLILIFQKSRVVRSLTFLTGLMGAVWAYGEWKSVQGKQALAQDLTKQAEKIIVKAQKARERGGAEPYPASWMRRHRCSDC